MRKHAIVPPIKCQGIKTKLVEDIGRIVAGYSYDRWVEPFCGSCVVAFSIQPSKALLCDTNKHIIRFYNDVGSGTITPGIVREFLSLEGSQLKEKGETHYYSVRERFNEDPSSLDFLFLNRSCFNGVMRFNRRGCFNVPFCRKPDRFSPAYITKIANQVKSVADILSGTEWEFRVSDFRNTLQNLANDDFVYADPPYAGRHVDYFNSWTEQDETDLSSMLDALQCRFALSTWHSNEFRSNSLIEKNWASDRFRIYMKEHYYHVGSTQDLRHPMIEALITNYDAVQGHGDVSSIQPCLLLADRRREYIVESI